VIFLPYVYRRPPHRAVVFGLDARRAFPDTKDELAWIAEDIQTRPEAERGGCVVLARSRKLLEEAARALGRAKLPVELAAPKREYESAPFRWLHALLRLARSRGDYEQLRRLGKAFYDLEGLTLSPDAGEPDLLAGWFQAALSRRELEPYTRAFLERTRERLLARSAFLEVAPDAFAWFEEVDRRLSGLPQGEFVDFREERRSWAELTRAAVDRVGAKKLGLAAFLQELDLSPKLSPFPDDAVKCMTIHTAKGMEFDHVYLIGMVEGYFPSFQSLKRGEGGRELLEERRGCYVALTRARESLTLTWAHRYQGFRKQPSRFLAEMSAPAENG
jgi:DNA helicase-2/ATP-dependent DNA helicase PcrA